MLSGGNYDRKFLHFLFSRCCSSCIALDILCTFFFSWKEKLQNWLHNFSMPATMESQKVSSQRCNFSRSLTQCTTVEVNRIKNLWKTCSSFTRERSPLLSLAYEVRQILELTCCRLLTATRSARQSQFQLLTRDNQHYPPQQASENWQEMQSLFEIFFSPCREAKKFNLN